MVQEPSFFTLAGHDVRRLRSRSVAVIDNRSPAASNRKLDRIGIVVLRSTTPCVAVSSFSSSAFVTVISIVPPLTSGTSVARVAVVSLTAVPPCGFLKCTRHACLATLRTRFPPLLLWLYLYQKYKETAVETDVFGNVDFAEKSLWETTLDLFSNLFIRALICVHHPKTTSSILRCPFFHSHPRIVHNTAKSRM